MILSFVGAGGKTTLIQKTAARCRAAGKTVFVTTTTHMYIEPDTLLTDDPAEILPVLQARGYAMAGIPEGEKLRALSPQTYRAICSRADVVLVEADGSRQLPLKFPGPGEPVIPPDTDGIVVVCGLNAIGQKAGDVCHRPELVKRCLGITNDTVITAGHVRRLVSEGYLRPLRQAYPDKTIALVPRHDGTPGQRALAGRLREEFTPGALPEVWF